MKTLFIEYTYLRGNRGGIYAARTHINLFAALSEEMTLVYPMADGMEPEGVDGSIKMIPVLDDRTSVKKGIDLLCGVVHRYSFDESFFDPTKYDVVVFDNSIVSSRLIKKFRKVGIKTITIHHNYQIEYLKGDDSLLTLIPDLFWTKKYEKDAVVNSNLNITLTDQDALLLGMHYSKNAKFATLGVFDYQKRSNEPLEERERSFNFVITGGLGSKQNERSLLPWLTDYYPIIKEVCPSQTLTIAGRSPSNALLIEAKKANARVLASPPDMSEILRNADYYICTTDCGGGLKLRIMDGLKFGLPVLTHEVSARGYEKMQHSGLVFSYKDKMTFKKSLEALIQTPKTRLEIQRDYIDCYSFDKGLIKLKQILIDNSII